MPELTIFYDGGCPLCASEIRHLSRLDIDQKIALQDINEREFCYHFPYIDPVRANQILHGELANGEIIYALDVTYTAWTLVGKHHWVAMLRWPLVKQVSHWVYLFFAKHRSRISKLLTGSDRCVVCEIKREER
jgi:predicted DCC family thiol-disulfide oxidoreductase YuxK